MHVCLSKVSKMFKKIRQRNCLLLIIVLILAPFLIIIMLMGPELSTEQSLTQRLAECHMRLQYLESMYRTRQEDVAILSQYLSHLLIQNSSTLPTNAAATLLSHKKSLQGAWLTPPTPPALQSSSSSSSTLSATSAASTNTSSNIQRIATAAPQLALLQSSTAQSQSSTFGVLNNLLDSLSAETRQLLRNATHTHAAQHFGTATTIRLPTAYHFLPHLLDDAASLRPAYIQTKNRNDVSIVLGIPTVKREKQSYLHGTLQNLIENMNEEEQNETLIIVYIGETEHDVIQGIAKQILLNFEAYIENGLIDIIAPSAAYYPNFNRLRITLNDSLERVKWRSKQNLDFAYLMAYAQSKGTFYVQLEDDILAKRGFITAMRKFAITKSSLAKPEQPAWFLLDFCQLGFIGKMFKSAELPYLITFFQMFYNDKPVDWLLTYFIESKVCRNDKDQKNCNLEKAKYWLHYRPSLFQHIGTSSSLKGKVQKLKDRQFGSKVPTFYAHLNNPPALVRTNIVAYKNFLLKRAYRGETYFWGLLPQPGDLVEFIFEKPIPLRHYLFRSGNSEHPSDRFYNTTVEIQLAEPLQHNESVAAALSAYNVTSDGFLIVGGFDAMGTAEGRIDTTLGLVREIRLHVHSDTENWALLSEIELLTVGGPSNEEHSSDLINSNVNKIS